MAHDFTSTGTAVAPPSGGSVITDLDAINTLLGVIGETPVASIDLTLPDVAIASSILASANRDVQAIGLNSNSDDRVHFAPIGGELIIPTYPYPVLRIDASNPGRNVVRRGLKLWDKDNLTYQFPDILCVDIVWLLPFADLPAATRIYITMKAAKQFQARVLGSEVLGPYTKEEEYVAYNVFQDEELNTGDFTMLNSPGLINLRNRVYTGWYGGCRLIDVSGNYSPGYGGDAGGEATPPPGTISMVEGVESSWYLSDSAGGFLTSMPDLAEGNSILVSGFSNPGNNGTFLVLYVDAGEIDISHTGFVEEGPIGVTIADLGVV